MLLCSVRECHLPLVREERRLVCARGHSFDIARSGYANLLQPQDRRSKQPGDTAKAVAARRRLHDQGVTEPLLRGISEILAPSSGDVVLDAGCGDGFYLGSLAAQTGFAAHGVDISIPAVDAAARRYPGCEWVVANADRFVPYADRSFSAVMSITARMNAPEFRRVLRDDGQLLVARALAGGFGWSCVGWDGTVWSVRLRHLRRGLRWWSGGGFLRWPIWMRLELRTFCFRFIGRWMITSGGGDAGYV